MTNRPCAQCSRPIPVDRARSKWCSDRCKRAANAARQRANYAQRSAIDYAVCGHCDRLYIVRRTLHVRDRRVCRSADCRRLEHNRRMRENPYQQRSRAKLGRPASTRAADARRRAVMRGASALGDPFTVDQVLDRDGWTCGICSGSIDPTVAYPSGQSLSIDHIVPLSRGGAHTFDNVQPAHLGCNSRKGVAAA